MILIFFINMFVLRISFRITNRLHSDALVCLNTKRHVEWVTVFWLFLISSQVSMRFSLSPLALALPVPVLGLSEVLLKLARRRRFRENYSLLVDQIVLHVRTGHSFREAIRKISDTSDAFVQQKLGEVIDHLTFPKPEVEFASDFFTREMIRSLREIDQTSYGGLRKLLALRHRLRIQNEFRRKSRAATAQIRVQALVLAILYGLVLIFTLRNEDIHSIAGELAISIPLFLIGLGLVLRTGRRYVWKH